MPGRATVEVDCRILPGTTPADVEAQVRSLLGDDIAYELGCLDSFRYPRYGGRGGLPLNLELLFRDLEKHVGSTVNVFELPQAAFDALKFMDEVEE